MKAIAKWIPKHVPNGLMLFVYWILDQLNIIRKKSSAIRREENQKLLESEETPLKKGLVDYQIEWSAIKYAKTTMAYAGCEVLAVYNVLVSLGKREAGPELIAELIEHFERHGAALGGKIGTSPKALYKYFCKNNIPARMIHKKSELENIDAEKMIVTYYNDADNLYKEIHTVAIIKEEEGYRIYNAGDRKAHPTMAEAIALAGPNPKLISAIILS